MSNTLDVGPTHAPIALQDGVQDYLNQLCEAFGFEVAEKVGRAGGTISFTGENTHLVIGNILTAFAHDEVRVEKSSAEAEGPPSITIVFTGVSLFAVKMAVASQLAILWPKRKEQIAGSILPVVQSLR